VAGLAAIGTAKGLGAQVAAFDTRDVVKEQVESLGARFLEVKMSEDGAGKGGYAKVLLINRIFFYNNNFNSCYCCLVIFVVVVR